MDYTKFNKSYHGTAHKGICRECVYAWRKGGSRWCIKRNGTIPKSKKFKQCENFKSKENP